MKQVNLKIQDGGFCCFISYRLFGSGERVQKGAFQIVGLNSAKGCQPYGIVLPIATVFQKGRQPYATI